MGQTKEEKPPDETGSAIHVQVLLFSVLREALGWDERMVVLQPPATGADLLDELQCRHPTLAAYRPLIRLAVNQLFVAADVSLSEGDEVAFITPVSGG